MRNDIAVIFKNVYTFFREVIDTNSDIISDTWSLTNHQDNRAGWITLAVFLIILVIVIQLAIAAVVSNENINDRMKDFFFRTEGCNPSKLILQHITPYVAQVLYEQATEALFDMELLKEANLNANYSYQMMINLIESHKLPESSQLDLAYRCVSNGSKRKDSEIATISCRTHLSH